MHKIDKRRSSIDDRFFVFVKQNGIEIPSPPYAPGYERTKYSRTDRRRILELIASHITAKRLGLNFLPDPEDLAWIIGAFFARKQGFFKRGAGVPRGTKWKKQLSQKPAAIRKRRQRARDKK